MTFLKNAWYVAAWSAEIVQGALFSRTLLGEPVVFFRKPDGSVAAIGDRCPHRFAPLHRGLLDGGQVQCPYHGLRFDASGICVHNPHGNGAIPRTARVRAYPLAERDLIVWIWMGDATLADASLIPDYSFLPAARPNARNLGYLPTAANYLLLTDNIMDLSHVDFLHPTTLGGGSLSCAKANVAEEGEAMRILWRVKNEVVPPAFARHMPDPEARADQWTEVVWRVPSLMKLSTSVEVPGQENLDTVNLHIMTPETETTTHYFYANTRNFLQDDADFNSMLDKFVAGIFGTEDKPMVEAQQRALGVNELIYLDPVMLPVDAGPIRVRRKLEALISREQHGPEQQERPVAAVGA